MKVSLQPLPPKQKLGEKVFAKVHFKYCRDGPVKIQKQGRDENTHEDNPTMERLKEEKTKRLSHTCCIYSGYRAVFLSFFSVIVS